MVKIYSQYCKIIKKIAEGEDLKEACLKWNANRRDEDDLWWAFEKSEYYIQPDEDDSNFDEVIQNYEKFIDSLTGKEMFEIMRDGNYHYCIDTNEVEEL